MTFALNLGQSSDDVSAFGAYILEWLTAAIRIIDLSSLVLSLAK